MIYRVNQTKFSRIGYDADSNNSIEEESDKSTDESTDIEDADETEPNDENSDAENESDHGNFKIKQTTEIMIHVKSIFVTSTLSKCASQNECEIRTRDESTRMFANTCVGHVHNKNIFPCFILFCSEFLSNNGVLFLSVLVVLALRSKNSYQKISFSL